MGFIRHPDFGSMPRAACGPDRFRADQTNEELRDAIYNGISYDVAWEMLRERSVFLPAEEDVPFEVVKGRCQEPAHFIQGRRMSDEPPSATCEKMQIRDFHGIGGLKICCLERA